ncbi:MAG: hypothetical protein ABI239_09220 [Aquihabitans sp.]
MQGLRFWRSPIWQKVLRVDSDHAEVEGLAAGTGLLTGDLTRSANAGNAPCPRCGDPGEVTAIDLVAQVTHRRCRSCVHTWSISEAEAVRNHQVPSHGG